MRLVPGLFNKEYGSLSRFVLSDWDSLMYCVLVVMC